MRALLALSLIVPLLAVGGGSVVAHEGDDVTDEIFDVKYAAIAAIDEVVFRFNQEVFEAVTQAERNALLMEALGEVDVIHQQAVYDIDNLVDDHPDQQAVGAGAVAYLDQYAADAEQILIQKHAEASEQGSTTTSTTTTTTVPAAAPPTIEILSPDDGTVFEEPSVSFSGIATPGAIVSVGQYTASTDDDGNWWITLVLSEGRNVARVVATNPAGQAVDQVVVYFEPPVIATTTTTSTSTTTTTTSVATTTTSVPTTTTTTSTTTTTVPTVVPVDDAGPTAGSVSVDSAFARLLEGRPTSPDDAGQTLFANRAQTGLGSAAVMNAASNAFAMIRPVVPFALEEPVFSLFAAVEMVLRALTASVRNLLGPAIVTLGYLVVSMVRRRRGIVA